MERHRFDAIARWLAHGTSRRGATAALAALAATRLVSPDETAARKRKHHKHKKKGARCTTLRQSCADLKNQRCCNDLSCEDVTGCDLPAGAACRADLQGACDGRCDCREGAICASGVCCLPVGSACAEGATTCCSGLSCIFLKCAEIIG